MVVWAEWIWFGSSPQFLISWDKKLLPARSTMMIRLFGRAYCFLTDFFVLFTFPISVSAPSGRCDSSASSMNFSYRMNGQRCWKVFECSFLFTTNLSDDILERSYNLVYPKDLWTLTGRFWNKFSLILWSFYLFGSEISSYWYLTPWCEGVWPVFILSKVWESRTLILIFSSTIIMGFVIFWMKPWILSSSY